MSQQDQQLHADNQSQSLENALGNSCISSASDQKVAFDTLNQKYLVLDGGNNINNATDAQAKPDSSSSPGYGKVIFFDSEGKREAEVDISSLQQPSEIMQDQTITDHMSEESEQKRNHQYQMFGDNWSILRFVKGNNSKTHEISPSGLSLQITRSHGGKGKTQNQEELVLTNMVFYYGLHFWEIIAPISCNNIQVGVYNPIANKEILASFKTTTPRTITVCLDLNENMLKFWLNDRRNSNKNIKLPPNNEVFTQNSPMIGGPWIPCVKIDKEKNKVILNPFAKEPSDFYEKDFDKKFTFNKYIMPFLHNMILVTNLPSMSNQSKEAAHQLKELFQLSSSNLNQILMPIQLVQDSSLQLDNTTKFCFIQFNYCESLIEFLQKHKKENKFTVYNTYEIAHWLNKSMEDEKEVPEELVKALKLLKDHINVPKSASTGEEGLHQTINSINNAYQQLVVDKQYKVQSNSSNPSHLSLNLSHQQFCDKLLVMKDQTSIKLVSRDVSTNDFDIASTNFSDPPQCLQTNVTLIMNIAYLSTFMRTINWSQLFKEENQIVNGIVTQFFDQLRQSATLFTNQIQFKVQLVIAKLFIEFATQQTSSQIDRIRRNLNNYSTVVQNPSTIVRKQNEVELDIVKKEALFYQDPNHSVDDLYFLLSILSDLTEQMWAQTRSSRCPPSVKAFLTSVSRPHSALNRLGSFIGWGFAGDNATGDGSIGPIQMTNNGMMLCKEGASSVCHFGNQQIELTEISSKALTDFDILQETLGDGNRVLNSLVSKNIPLYKTLNYLPPQTLFQYQITSVIASQNSGFVLIGGQQGIINISHALLDLTSLKTLSFFQNDIEKKQRKYPEILSKIDMRKTTYDNYRDSIAKKAVGLSLVKDFKMQNDENKVEMKHKTEKKKAQKLLKTEKAKQAKLIASELAQKSKEVYAIGVSKAKCKKIQKKKFMPTPSEITTANQPQKLTKSVEKPVEVKQTKSPNQQNSSQEQTYEKCDQFNCKVLGYILLSKPAYEKFIDPLTVGCVYYNIKSQKFYLKTRKIIFLLSYLQNFIAIDSQSGQQMNKISGKQILEENDFKKLYEEILNHQDVVVDLYSMFMRNQVYKKDWPKKDQKFSILIDISEAEIEIQDCSHLIDFTKCSYSIDNQDKIHFIVESPANQDGEKKVKLIQYTIEEKKYIEEVQIGEEKNKVFHGIKIDKTQEVVLSNNPLRVFQYDRNVVIVSQSSYQIICQDTLEVEKEISLKHPLDEQLAKKITIINKSDQSKIFNKTNLGKYNSKSAVPQQDWRLIIEQSNEHVESYTLREESKIKSFLKQKTVKASSFSLKQVLPNDILQIGNLLECKYMGTIAQQNSYSHLTSSCIDQLSNQFTHHSWHLLQSQKIDKQGYEFTLKIPSHYQQSQLRQIDIEFSFRKKASSALLVKHNFQSKNEKQQILTDPKSLKRIPLMIEQLVGAQISDSVQPCYLTFPDSQVFASNYPQPEFIFKHHSNKTFVAHQFVIKSKENREWNGVPISQGVIFVSDSLEDLQNTKQFSKFTEKEYKQWKAKRDQFSEIPLLPSEPIAFFDLDDLSEITITLDSPKACRFVKFIPTAFRKRPINFTSKPFNSNQAECQFFGVNGKLLESEHRGLTTGSDKLEQIKVKELEVEIKAILSEKNIGQIGEVDSVHISEIRNAKPQNHYIPITSLDELKNQNIIGVAKQQIVLKEDDSDSIEELTIQIPASALDNENWEFSGLTMSVKTFTDQAVIFSDSTLQENKPRLRHYLLDPSSFDKVLKQLLDIIEDEKEQTEELKTSSLQCILVFLRRIGKDKNLHEFLRLFKENTRLEKVLQEHFISYSQNYQVLVIRYLESIGVLSKNKEFIAQFIEKQINKFLERKWNKQNLQTVFDLMQWCSNEDKMKLQSKTVDILFNKICNELLPKFQTEEYLIIRSKLNINAFPFDDSDSLFDSDSKAPLQTLNSAGKTFDGYLQLLDCQFEMTKINTLYHYNVDFKNPCLVDKLKLIFDQDNKSLYKIGVKVIVPDSNGREQLLVVKQFDENTFTHVCERSQKEDNVQYFNSAIKSSDKQCNGSTIHPIKQQISTPKQVIEGESPEQPSTSPTDSIETPSTPINNINNDMLDLNSITIDLNGYVGRYLKIQIELQDSYRTVHKIHPCSQIFIRPELYGQNISQFNSLEESPEDSLKFASFKIREPEQQYLLAKKTLGNIPYQLYQIPHNYLSRLNKALLFVMPSNLQKAQAVMNKESDQQLQELNQQVEIKRIELRDLIDNYIISSSKDDKALIKTKIEEISKLQTQQQQLSNSTDKSKASSNLSLSYILNIADLLSLQIVQSIKQNPSLIAQCDIFKDMRSLYMTIFTHFGVQDQLSNYPNVNKLLEIIFGEIKDKSQFMFQILQEFVFENDQTSLKTMYSNQTNIIEFIQSMQQLDFNELLQNYLVFIGYSDNSQVEIDSDEKVSEVLVNLQQKGKDRDNKCTINQMLLFMKLLDDIKTDSNKAKDQPLQLDLLLKVLSHFISTNYTLFSKYKSKVFVLIQFTLTVIQKYLSVPATSCDKIFTQCQTPILQIMMVSLQSGKKPILKVLKKILVDLAKKDTKCVLNQVVGSIIQWFKNKDNIKSYSKLDLEKPGTGTTEFIKHLSLAFKFYTKILKHSKLQESQLEETYKQLGEMMTDVLQVLPVDDDASNDRGEIPMDDDTFTIVWVQLFQILSQLDLQTLKKKKVFEQLAEKFFKLPLVVQQSLYPKFHQKSEKIIQVSTGKDPFILVLLLKAFLNAGFQSHQKVTYCICDGFLNIIQSEKKDVASPTIISTKFSEESMHELFQILQNFITIQLNKGVYNGVTGSYVDIVMRLDLANQMTNILLNAQVQTKQNAFEQYVKSSQDKVPIIESVLEWLFINCQNQKGKNAPASEKIYTLSTNLEQLLCKIQVCDQTVAQCLPILMKSVLKIDNKLRDLFQKKKINYERGIQLQKNCNSLFLVLFKTWVQNDTVAKQFLTELSGFDFLLDRLFSKNEKTSTGKHPHHQDSNVLSEEETDEEIDALVSTIKLKLHKDLKLIAQSSKKEEVKPLPGSLPPISKKQTAILPSSKFEEDEGQLNNIQSQSTKDIENALLQEDFGRAMKLIWSSDKEKAVAATYAMTQWNKFKNGTKNRIYNFQISDSKYEYEYAMQFDLEKVVQVSEIQVGLLYNWSTYDVDSQYEPLSFIVEGSVNKGQESDWKVLLNPIEDGGYSLNCISVYGHNFLESQGGKFKDKLETSLESIGCKECRYLTFRMRKPLLCCLETSMYIGCLKKIKSYGFSYISVNGVSLEEDKPIYPYLIDLQKNNSLEVLSKFFSGEFTEAFELIAEQPQIIEKIKNAFDKLSILLDNKAALVKPIFLSICAKNQSLSDWIMMERLISLDEKKIKKEQIKFLGDIISSCKDKQLEKLNKIKDFILQQINKCAKTKVLLSHSQQILFSRYINLFCQKIREHALAQESNEDLKIDFQVEDLEDIISMMRSCEAGKSKFFNSLNKLALLLLVPPVPFQNMTISTDEYVDRLLSSDHDDSCQLQYLLFSSLIASTNNKAMDTIIARGKIEWIIKELNSKNELNSVQSFQMAQILYNCSKKESFRSSYRATIPFDLYNILKQNDPNREKLLKANSSEQHIDLIVQTIKDVVIGGEEEEEKLASILKTDILEASDKVDVAFINQVIVPILHAQEQYPLCISILDPLYKNQGLKPIFNCADVESKGSAFFLKTDILSQKQKSALLKNFKDISEDKVENFSKMVNDTKWDLIFSAKSPIMDSSKFRQFVLATENKSNIMILLNCKLNGSNAVLGGYCTKPFPVLGAQWAHEFDYQIPYGDGNFVFYYTLEKELHFTMTNNKPFGYIYTDYEEGGALSVSGDFFLVSWSYEFQNSCGNIYDMKCIEDPSIMTFYSNMEVQSVEIWWANMNEKSVIENGKVKHELKNHRWFKQFSPYNFFRENLVFEVSKEIKLSKVAQEILGKGHIFIKYPSEDTIESSITVSKLYLEQKQLQNDPIMDLVVLQKEPVKQPEITEKPLTDQLQVVGQKLNVPKGFGAGPMGMGMSGISPMMQSAMTMMPPMFSGGPMSMPPYPMPNIAAFSFPPAQNLGGMGNPPQFLPQDFMQVPMFSGGITTQLPPVNPNISSALQSLISNLNQAQVAPYIEEVLPVKVDEEDKDNSPPDQPILRRFEAKGGILDLIKAARQAVKLYKSEKLREMWGLWLSEIESFSTLPTFFSTFSTSDREKEAIVYKLIDGEFDRAVSKQTDGDAQKGISQQEELHIEMVKYSYKIVNDVFEKHEGAELRDLCLQNGTFERFFERIGQLSSEKTRVKVKKNHDEDTLSKSEKSEVSPPAGNEMKKEAKKEKKDDPYQKRKGVGYTTGVGTQWNVSEYLKSKEAKSAQAANIVNILKNVIKSKDWQAPIAIKNMILESALLPTLESAFRSGSLLEMAKDFELNMAYLGFVQELIKHEALLDLLLDIGDDYEPRQKESISTLLAKLGELSTIFLGCLTSDTSQSTAEETKPKLLAEKIQETQKLVSEKLAFQAQVKEQQSLQEILEMPLSEAYYKLLSSLRFEYMSMKDSSGLYQHSYQMELVKNTKPPVTKLIRLAQEIADLSNSLPCDYMNGIFCRVDKEQVDMMKCMIMGASGTPYAHGAFVYDLFFENSYPNTPPKCQLTTTGGQTVRFNPNLYNNGKVCLSLLGTWRGSSTENWDPKLSTILQVLLSIQAIIMSNEVYFNEPGYEHEAGTPEGEKKNEGYANIVRYCNVKFAIIDAIKNPPKGFEKVIKRNFYLKKNEVLREVKEWVDRSKTTEALYTGLVYDHNYQWAPQISQPGKYVELMEQIYKELKETLESIKSPFEDETTGLSVERKFSKTDWEEEKDGKHPKDKKFVGFQDQVFDDVDVTYDKNPVQKMENQSININDEKVKDRWSRYIGAMGIEAVAKQAESRILLLGQNPLGIEIAKNIVLAGCKELIIFDEQGPALMDLSGGQFFLNESDVDDFQNHAQHGNWSRAEYIKDKLQQLNFYVKVSVLNRSVDITEYIKSNDLKVVVMAFDALQVSLSDVTTMNSLCREKGIGFIHTCQNGLFSKIFTDFGGLGQTIGEEEEKQFVVIDKDGEELQEVMIDKIVCDDTDGCGIVTLQQGFKHKFEDGDKVIIKEVVGMNKISNQEGIIGQEDSDSINGTIHTVKQLNPTQFKIGPIKDLYTDYKSNGLAKQVKVPKLLKFKQFSQIEKDIENKVEVPFDQNLLIADFEKMDNSKFGQWCYQTLLELVDETRNDEMLLIQGSNAFEELVFDLQEKVELMAKEDKDFNNDDFKNYDRLLKYLYTFLLTISSYFGPLAAFIGGIVTQEIVKAITQKFVPINQLAYFDNMELSPYFINEDESKEEQTGEGRLQEALDIKNRLQNLKQDRYIALRICLGNTALDKIQKAKVFMVGAGAIGCELLKNYAMLGVGVQTNGHIILTDPDVIEVSNLNRQFLFREKHLRKPKSSTAAAAAIQMNPDLKGHINARLDKIHDGTSNIYNEHFFKEQTIITNALDNVQARLYIDGRCVSARVPLIDSGTLGPKGHVQMIIPFKTESYASQNDPEDNTQIPHCTLKMFPEETLHCVEWAKDIFGHIFGLQGVNYNKLVHSEKGGEPNFYDQQELVMVKKVIKTIEKAPKNFDDCINLARRRFEKHFSNDIKQLLHVYPLDKQTKEGRLFWSLPKRAPRPIPFDSENALHVSFIAACSCLYARIFNIDIPFEQPRSSEAKSIIAKKADEIKLPEFIPNDMKASQIAQQVEKEQKKGADEEDNQEQQITQQQPGQDAEEVKKKYHEFVEPLKKGEADKQMRVEEFEKDVDDNFHVDFIHAMANIRASNYKLEEMDWLTVKIKAGRIIPALATTTAAIAALQTIEMIKVIKGCKIEVQRNSFLNLAVPSLMMSEPGAPAKTKIKEGLEVTLWDRWEMEDVSPDVSLLQIGYFFEQKYNLAARDIFYGSMPLFLNVVQGKDKNLRMAHLNKQLRELINISSETEFVDLTITFVYREAELEKIEKEGGDAGGETILKGIPITRIFFKKDQSTVDSLETQIY